MSNKKKKKQQPKVTSLAPRQKVVGAYLTLMFGLFPVFCSDGFFNIRHDRFYFFAALSLALLAFWILTLLAGDLEDAIGKITVTDWAMLGFLAVCILSTIFSIQPEKALWGTGGRNNGLFLMAIYVAIYFMVSRNGRPIPVIFAVLGIVSVFVSLVAVLNFFSLDPLKMLEPLSDGEKKIFFSTIGNKNLLSGYLCIVLPVLTVLYVEDSPKWLRVLSLVCLVPGFAALMIADSDSGFLGLGVFAAVYLIFYCRNPIKLKRLMLVVTVMLLSARLLQPVAYIPGLQIKRMGSIQRFLVCSTPALWLLAAMTLLTGLLHLLCRKKPHLDLPEWLPPALAALFGAGLLAAGAVALYLTLNPEIPVQGILSHFRLDDHWGTNRGYMWRRSMDIFRGFNLWRMLFGTGPDTFYYAFEPYFEELKNYWMSSTNAAHNEYLNYLITVGILGVAAYCTALVSEMIRCFRLAKHDPMAKVCCAAVICYAAQALVSIAQPITTPFFILFLALSASVSRSHDRKGGQNMNDPHSEAVAQEQTAREEVADRELAALNGVLQHFSLKQASYDLYDNLCERINYFARSTPMALIVWGISMLTVALLLAGGMFFLLRGGMLSPEKLPVILAACGCLVPLPGLLMLTVGILMKVNCRRKLELSRKEFDTLSQELYQHFLRCPNCPVSPEYTNPRILNQLQNLIYYGKTDTVKDSLNNTLAASNPKAIARYLKLISRNTAGHGSNVIFLPPRLFIQPSELSQ